MGSVLNVNLHDNLTFKISFIMNWLPVTGLYVSQARIFEHWVYKVDISKCPGLWRSLASIKSILQQPCKQVGRQEKCIFNVNYLKSDI